MKLAVRVALATVATALVAVAFVALVGGALANRFLENNARQELQRDAAALAEILEQVEVSPFAQRPLPGNRERIRALERLLRPFLDRNLIDGRVINLDNPSGPAQDLLSASDLADVRQGESVEGRGEIGGEPVVFVAVPGPPSVLVYRPVEGLGIAGREVGRRLLFSGVIAALVAGLIGLWVGRRIARPVGAVQDAVHDVAAGDLTKRVAPTVSARPDEIGDLARGVDAMTSSLADAREEQRGFFRAVAHELRTPLTNIQGYAEGLIDNRFTAPSDRDAAVEVIHQESLRLSRLVSDVMTLAQIDAGAFTIDASPGDVATVVEACVAAAREVADAAGIELRADAQLAPIATDPDRVRQILDNLVGNALRITPAGGQVTVRCRPDGQAAILEVSDSGPGLTPEEVPHAFERYFLWRRYRGEREVGTGLGLAIVAELTQRMGGTVSVDPGGNGAGATFRVSLPKSPPVSVPHTA